MEKFKNSVEKNPLKLQVSGSLVVSHMSPTGHFPTGRVGFTKLVFVLGGSFPFFSPGRGTGGPTLPNFEGWRGWGPKRGSTNRLILANLWGPPPAEALELGHDAAGGLRIVPCKHPLTNV